MWYRFALSLVLVMLAPLTLASPEQTCRGQVFNQTFASSASWHLCWQIKPIEGLVLSQVAYQAPAHVQRRVLGDAALSQLETTLDDNSSGSLFLTAEQGLGSTIQTLTTADCPNGTLYKANNRAVLCATVGSQGYLYKDVTPYQNQFVDLISRSQLDKHIYLLRWRLYENGTIEPAWGLTGELPIVNTSNPVYGWPAMSTGKIAISFTQHAFWRLDIDLDNTATDDVIEEITSTPTPDRLRKTKAINAINVETGRLIDPETKRFWRVRDGAISNGRSGFISYELVPARYDQSRLHSSDELWLGQDVFFTRYQACEQQAAHNQISACASDVSQFTNQESLKDQDIVLWYQQTYHHLPRSEDSNGIRTVWNSFQLVPRDWSAQNPL